MKTYVSTIIEKNNKFLLIKEAKRQCFGKWNFPSGHVEENEYILDAAIREVKEETNLDVELSGLISIYNNMFLGFNSMSFIFVANRLNDNEFIIIKPDEILEISWFSSEQITDMKNELRDPDYIIDSIKKYEKGNIKPLDIVVTR